jgi:hypothetical protein
MYLTIISIFFYSLSLQATWEKMRIAYENIISKKQYTG